MNKAVIYIVIALLVLSGLGFLAWFLKSIIKYGILLAIVVFGVWAYRTIRKKFGTKKLDE